MIGLKEYMKKTGVTKISYVKHWVESDYIPGVIKGKSISDTQFPDSARRPYCSRWLKPGISTEKLRAHIVKACLDRRYISKELCFMSAREFEDLMLELEKAGFIRKRVEDGITYFDATMKSEEYKGKDLLKLRKAILSTFVTVTEAVVKSSITAVLNHQTAC